VAMIRKQIMLPPEQEQALKALARRTGKSEGAIIREAIASRLSQEAGDAEGWERLVEHWLAQPVGGAPWRRDEGHEERVGRYERHVD